MLGEWGRRIWYLLNRARIERELEAEMAAHREMMGDGRGFGNVLKLREQSRDVWGWGWLDRLVQDVRHAARILRRAPTFAITAILILAVGIGLNLTFFHLMNVTTLQPVAVKAPATLVRFHRHGPRFNSSGMPYPATQFIRHNNDVLAAVLTYATSDAVLDGDASSAIATAHVSANWFQELGYDAAVGRVFSERIDDAPGAPAVAIVSDRFWRTRLGSAPDVIGRPLRLNHHVATIVGVAPPDLPDPDMRNPQVWMPIEQIDRFDPGTAFKTAWDTNNSAFYARLRPNVTAASVADGLRPSLAALAQSRPNEFGADEWLEAASAEEHFLHARNRQKVLLAASLIGALTLLVLGAASANLGNLVLSHAIGRLRELSVRSALGASRARIMRHILTECGLLALAGGVAGVFLAEGGARLLAALTELPPYLDFSPDRRLVAAGFAAAFVAMLVSGLVPAWMVTRRDLITAMKDGGHQASAGLARARLRLALVGAQVVCCCTLLVVATSLTRGLQRLLVDDPGFRFDHLARLDASLERHGIAGDAARQYWARVTGELSAHPEVAMMALAAPPPLGGATQTSGYSTSRSLIINVTRVEPAFFDMLDIPLLAGRNFAAGEPPTSVIISQRLALTMYGTLDVIGEGYPRPKSERRIVGIARDARLQMHAENSAEEYMPMNRSAYQSAALLVASRGKPETLLGPLREVATRADARVLPGTRLLTTDYRARLRAPQLAATIAALVAVLVLLLACLGIFGVIAYAVKLRTKEIGIRRALGADPIGVLAVVLRQLAWPVLVGVALGTGAGLAASRLFAAQPLYLAVTDATAPAAALGVFALAALTAAIIPASRALGVDPVRALRHE